MRSQPGELETDRRQRADGAWKALHTVKAKSALKTLARIAPTRRAAEGRQSHWSVSRFFWIGKGVRASFSTSDTALVLLNKPGDSAT